MPSDGTREFLVVIPARYESSRLPGKPLVSLCGVPMIVRTWQRCAQAAAPCDVVVATDDARIADICASAGIEVVMTSRRCLTGTDRVAEVARQIPARTYVNVQGDEPVFNPDDLTRLLEHAALHPGDVINGYCAIESEAQFRSTSVPKAVVRADGRLLYMSRAPIPTDKTSRFERAWRQVCAYAFPADALAAFSACERKTPLEQIEDIEILRFLELGWEVRMLEMSADSVAVDNPEDVARAEAAIRRMELA